MLITAYITKGGVTPAILIKEIPNINLGHNKRP